MKKHTPSQRARIRAVSGLAIDTIVAIENGESVREASLLRYERALRELKQEAIASGPPKMSAGYGGGWR